MTAPTATDIERKQREAWQEAHERLDERRIRMGGPAVLEAQVIAAAIMEQIADFIPAEDHPEVWYRTWRALHSEGVILDPQQEVQL